MRLSVECSVDRICCKMLGNTVAAYEIEDRKALRLCNGQALNVKAY